ncbi:putative NBD/HSP70 family sugar kinase [Bradyrhizobium diazoefficiens]
MENYAGIDVSLELSSVCVVDAQGKILKEAKVASEPDALVEFFETLGFAVKRIGLEAGPPSARFWPGCAISASFPGPSSTPPSRHSSTNSMLVKCVASAQAAPNCLPNSTNPS